MELATVLELGIVLLQNLQQNVHCSGEDLKSPIPELSKQPTSTVNQHPLTGKIMRHHTWVFTRSSPRHESA